MGSESSALWDLPSISPSGGSQLQTIVIRRAMLRGDATSTFCDALVWAASFQGTQSTLRGIRFESCHVGSDPNTAGDLERVFAAHRQLRVVEITSTPDSEPLYHSFNILDGLRNCDQLQELTFSVVQAGSDEQLKLAGIVGQLIDRLRTLQVLRLPTLSGEATNVIWTALSKYHNPLLEVLHLSGVPRGFNLKATVKDRLTRLRHLDISPSSNLTPEDVEEIRAILRRRSVDAKFIV